MRGQHKLPAMPPGGILKAQPAKIQKTSGSERVRG